MMTADKMRLNFIHSIKKEAYHNSLFVKLGFHKVRCQGPLSLYISGASTFTLVTSVHQNFSCVFSDLNPGHYTAGIHPGSDVYSISPDIILRLLSPHNTSNDWSMIQT